MKFWNLPQQKNAARNANVEDANLTGEILELRSQPEKKKLALRIGLLPAANPLYSIRATIHFGIHQVSREILDRWIERGILSLVLILLVFGPLAMGAVDAWAFLVVQGLIILAMFFWGLRIGIGRDKRLLWPPISWVVLAFALYSIGRYLTADIEFIARLQMIQVLLYAFLFFVIINTVHRQESIQIISLTLIFLAALISCYALYQFVTHSNQVWNLTSPYKGRGVGTYISPNDFAGFLEMLLPLAVAYALIGRVKPVTRALLIYAAVAMMAGLAATLSRGGWVAAAAGLLLLLLILVSRRDHRLPALCLLIILVAGGTIFLTRYLTATLNYAHRTRNPETFTQLDWNVRQDMWGAALQMWRDHFWWGVGPALYDYRFPQYRPETMQLRPGWVHNDYLNLVAEWGAAGGIIVAAGMAIFIFGLIKTWKYVSPPENDFGRGQSNRFAFLLGASMGLLALAVHSVLDFNLHIPANAILGVTLLALLSGHLRYTDRYEPQMRSSIKLLVAATLIAGMAYLGVQGYFRTGERYWLSRADALPELSSARLAALKMAYAAEPRNSQTTYDIGEIYREQSFHGAESYQDLATNAMDWYRRGMVLNPYDSYNYLRYGMCLDWLGHHAQAGTYFNRADALDPNGYFTAANEGWHYVQSGDYAAARSWLARSLRLQRQDNIIAASYLQIAEQKLVDDASRRSPLPPGF